MSLNPLKVLIIGGGPVGLTAACALTRLNIDFTLLERRPSPIIETGANLVLNPVGMRALYHLNLHDELAKVSSQLREMHRVDHEGRAMPDMNWFLFLKEHFGSAPITLSRTDLTRILYSSLPATARSKILVNKNVTSLTPTDTGMTVSCSDNTSYTGTFVLGADGAHSKVRAQMRELALAANSPAVNPAQPFLTTYRCLWVRFKPHPDIPAGMSSETHGYGASMQVFATQESGVAGVYEKLEGPTRERLRYTAEDEAQLIEKWGNLPFTPSGTVKLRDVYANRIESGLVSLEEGVVPHWSYDGRIVLTGDAAHKFTPSTGDGCNNGIVDVVALVNELANLTKGADEEGPSREELADAFKRYQEKRFGDVEDCCDQSGRATQTSTWDNGVVKFLDQWVFGSKMFQRVFIGIGAAKAAKTAPFVFATEEKLVGKTPWAVPVMGK